MEIPPVATCPLCGGKAVPIAYGLPGPSLMQAAERGEVALGGCVITHDENGRLADPDRRCLSCGHSWKAAAPTTPSSAS